MYGDGVSRTHRACRGLDGRASALLVWGTPVIGALASAPQPPGPSARRFLCLECKEADRPREAQRFEHVAQHQGDRVSPRREEKAGLPRLPGPDLGAETPSHPTPPYPIPGPPRSAAGAEALGRLPSAAASGPSA